MTFVGKILVIVILAFSLFFLALSTVVMSASSNWRDAYDAAQADLQEARKQVQQANAEKDQLEAAHQQELAARQSDLAALQQQNTTLQTEVADLEQETTDLRDRIETTTQNADRLSAEAQARAEDADELRDLYADVQKTSNDLSIRQTQLEQEKFDLQRALDNARQKNEDLRGQVGNFQAFLRSRNLPSDPDAVATQTQGVQVSPDIEGRVLEVDPRQRIAILSIGSDDGVVVGQQYQIFRLGDDARYVGYVQVKQVSGDKSVASIERRHMGYKVEEGDNVAGQIRPRG